MRIALSWLPWCSLAFQAIKMGPVSLHSLVCLAMPFTKSEVVADVKRQLYRYEKADSGEDIELKKNSNDFNSLYLNSKVDYSPQNIACGAAWIKLLYEVLLNDESPEILQQALNIEEKLNFVSDSKRKKSYKSILGNC